MTTIKEIADLAGVSRGTVDRVLNNRGAVNPKTAEKIMKIAQAMNYRPNRVGLALATQKKKYKIGVILFSEHNPFFDEVMAGCKAKRKSCRILALPSSQGVWNSTCTLSLPLSTASWKPGIHGLMLAPYNHPLIQQKIDELAGSRSPL